MKTCKKCGKTKPPDDFYTTQAICKCCSKAQVAAYQAANREKVDAYKAAYYAANREKWAEYRAVYRAKDPERQSAYSAAYRAQNREKLASYQAAYRAKNLKKVGLRQAKKRDELAPHYVASQLGISLKQAPPELLALKREQLTILRLARKLKKAANESSKNPD